VRRSGYGSVTNLFDTVISNGYCIGCGVCAAVTGSPIEIGFDQYGRLQAKVAAGYENALNAEVDVASVCPFSDDARDEDAIAFDLYGRGDPKPEKRSSIGFYRALYAGYAIEQGFRENGSSGGLGSWMLVQLLATDMVDAIVHVRSVDPAAKHGVLFEYGISRTAEDVNASAKSRYYPIEMSRILGEIRRRPGRYAIVGIPCFIKGVRLLAENDAVIRERVRYTIGLFCGHLKSTRFASLFAWQNGIHPDDIQEIDFRRKLPDRPSYNYGVRIKGIKAGRSVEIIRENSAHFGYLWGHGFFKYKACDYCDDVVAETADVSIGDAWLQEYVADANGTNIIIVRNAEILSMIETAVENKSLQLDAVTHEQVEKSQDAGFRHRRDGLAYRLHRRLRKHEWCPNKRIRAGVGAISIRRRAIYILREILAEQSHKAFNVALQRNDFEVFRSRMGCWLWFYELLYKKNSLLAALGRVLRLSKSNA